MTEEPKRKNEESRTEWSFDFGKVGESVSRFFEGLAGDEEINTSVFSVAREGVESADIEVRFSAGVGALHPLTDGEHLFSAELRHVGEVVLHDEGEARKKLKLEQKINPRSVGGSIRQGFRAMAEREELRWNIGVSTGVPVSLDVNGGAGPVTLDLTGLDLIDLKVDNGVGTIAVTLPAQEEHFEAEIDGGVGETRIVIPEGCNVDLEIDGGVGAVEIALPVSAAVRLNAETGIGAINVPASFKRLTEKEEFFDKGGTWQTDGYDLASGPRINIKYDGGIGQLRIVTASVV